MFRMFLEKVCLSFGPCESTHWDLHMLMYFTACNSRVLAFREQPGESGRVSDIADVSGSNWKSLSAGELTESQPLACES